MTEPTIGINPAIRTVILNKDIIKRILSDSTYQREGGVILGERILWLKNNRSFWFTHGSINTTIQRIGLQLSLELNEDMELSLAISSS